MLRRRVERWTGWGLEVVAFGFAVVDVVVVMEAGGLGLRLRRLPIGLATPLL